jgi:hypothetical protein
MATKALRLKQRANLCFLRYIRRLSLTNEGEMDVEHE